MNTLMAVGTGGALGAILRYWVSNGVHSLVGRDFPYGTLAVNVIGSLAMGFLSIWLVDRMGASLVWRIFILAGVLGGFTTFSAFSMETFSLLAQGAYLRSLANVMLSVIVCLVAAGAGVWVARSV